MSKFKKNRPNKRFSIRKPVDRLRQSLDGVRKPLDSYVLGYLPNLSYSSHNSRQHQLSWYLVGSDDDLENLANILPAGGEEQ